MEIDHGFVTTQSALDVPSVVERLEQIVAARGMTVFARFDHAANAHEVGLELRPTTVVVFGDARVGTKLMLAAQTIAIELPLRVLVWSDGAGQTWLGYNDPSSLARRHGLAADALSVKMGAALADLVQQAAHGATGRSP
jgi:uncharacterized protein (DUF302 family)